MALSPPQGGGGGSSARSRHGAALVSGGDLGGLGAWNAGVSWRGRPRAWTPGMRCALSKSPNLDRGRCVNCGQRTALLDSTVCRPVVSHLSTCFPASRTSHFRAQIALLAVTHVMDSTCGKSPSSPPVGPPGAGDDHGRPQRIWCGARESKRALAQHNRPTCLHAQAMHAYTGARCRPDVQW